jgi:hypothetical protein
LKKQQYKAIKRLYVTPVAPHTSPRVAPSIVPPPMVAPTNVRYPRVHAQADPYEDEPIVGINLLGSFEEEDVLPAPRYNTRSNARRNAANHVTHTASRIFRPIDFSNSASCDAPLPSGNPSPVPSHIPMANVIMHPTTGASMEYIGLLPDE